MKRLSLLTLILAALMLACNISTPVPATQQPPPPTNTPELPATPTVAETPAVQPNAVCNELSFFLDPAVAADIVCETVPQGNGEDPWDVHPQFTKAAFQGYALADKFHNPRISVYPLPAYIAQVPKVADSAAFLKSLIGGGDPGTGAIPVLESSFNAAQEFHAQYQVVRFANGAGVRFVTQYAQYFAPINNHDMFFTFQGITADDQYWISIILPITNPVLPANADNPPGGMSWEEFGNQFDTYIADLANQLNGQPADSFAPSITLLDSLIQSISVQP